MGFKEGMVRVPVDIENATIEVNLDLDNDEVAVGGVKFDGTRVLMKVLDDGTGKGQLFVVPVSIPGATITSPADVVIGVGATVPLPAVPAGTTQMTVQNTGPAGTFIRVRELAGVVGTGFLLPRFGSKTFGSPGGSVAPLEAEEVIASLATAAMIQYEGP
jgi:hypothetical protein